MHPLLNLANAANTLSSLQLFYDTVENHIRRLSSLGKSPESYGDLLTPIIFWKLPKEIQKSLARSHNNTEWTLYELRASIMKEIQILETKVHSTRYHDEPTHSDVPSITTDSFCIDTHRHSHNHQTLGM